MNKYIYNIFDKLQEDIPNIAIAETILRKEVEELLKPLKEILSIDEYEEIRSLFYQIGLIAEREGFVLGFEFAVKLFFESFNKS